MQRFIQFVCQKYFEGSASELKEYSIAVAALNRGEAFNPQSDTVVRVTAHALRRRLEQYYREEGAGHAIHIVLPSGTYCPRFVWSTAEEAPHTSTPSSGSPPAASRSEPSAPLALEPAGPTQRNSRIRGGWIAGLAVLCAVTVVCVLLQKHRGQHVEDSNPAKGGASGLPLGATGGGIRFLPGDARPAYIDAAGQSWVVDSFCTGGARFKHTGETISGSDDPELLESGRAGRFRCLIPLRPGNYELHLFFADTFHGQEATRQVGYSVNGAKPQTIDVTDEAGGSSTATERIYPDVHPAADGKVHLDFVTDDSFVNAIELVPASSGTMAPLRILAGRAAYRDQQDRLWLSDRFFLGGRRTYRADGLPSLPNPGLFQYERFGHFQYWLPVIPEREYALTLYFEEGWYGQHAGGTGGPGSRVFDVYCNGATLLKHFDILAQNPDGFAVKTFHHLKPTAQGKLELFFTPVTNYPLVDAIEVEQEASPGQP